MAKRGRDDDEYASASSRPPPSARPSTPPPTPSSSKGKAKAKAPPSPASSTLSSPPSSPPPTPPSFKLAPSPVNTHEPMDWCTTAWYLIDWMDWLALPPLPPPLYDLEKERERLLDERNARQLAALLEDGNIDDL